MLYRHYKGGLYAVIEDNAIDESTHVKKVIYRSIETGQCWVRDRNEFYGYTRNFQGQLVRRFLLEEAPKEKVDFTNSCISCRFFCTKSKECTEHRIKTTAETPKCNDWRYFG